MAKKVAITKVLSCLVVGMLLMSVMPVSVFAVNDSINSTGNASNCSNETLLEKAFAENNSAEAITSLFNNNTTGKYQVATWTKEDNSDGDCAPIPEANMPEIYLNDTVATVLPEVSNDTRKNVSALGCSVYVKIDDDTCVGYDVYVDGVYKLTEGEGGTPDGYCAFYVSAGTHKFELRKNGCSTSKSWYCQCGTVYRWVSMPDNWCRDGGGTGTCINFDELSQRDITGQTLHYDQVDFVAGSMPTGGGVMVSAGGHSAPNDIFIAGGQVTASFKTPVSKVSVWVADWAGGTQITLYASDGRCLEEVNPRDGEYTYYEFSYNEKISKVDISSYEGAFDDFCFEIEGGTPCKVYVIIDDNTCSGYEVYVDGVYQFTEGQSGTPDGYCAFYVPEGTHKFELRKNGCSVSKSWYCQCGTTYRWVSMNDMDPHWCNCHQPKKEVKFRGMITALGPYVIGSKEWYVSVDEWISGSLPCDEIDVIIGIYPPMGHWDENINKGDRVEVYGVVNPWGEGECTVGLNGESYYINKTSSNNPPTLTEGKVNGETLYSSDTSTQLIFTVKYSDPDNDEPEYVKLKIGDSFSYNMVKADPSDNDYTDGCIYTYSTKLPRGKYFFTFSTSDGNYHVSIEPNLSCPFRDRVYIDAYIVIMDDFYGRGGNFTGEELVEIYNYYYCNYSCADCAHIQDILDRALQYVPEENKILGADEIFLEYPCCNITTVTEGEIVGTFKASYSVDLDMPIATFVGDTRTIPVTITNIGDRTWMKGTFENDKPKQGTVFLSYHIFYKEYKNDEGYEIKIWDDGDLTPIPNDIPPGESCLVYLKVTIPNLPLDKYELFIDAVAIYDIDDSWDSPDMLADNPHDSSYDTSLLWFSSESQMTEKSIMLHIPIFIDGVYVEPDYDIDFKSLRRQLVWDISINEGESKQIRFNVQNLQHIHFDFKLYYSPGVLFRIYGPDGTEYDKERLYGEKSHLSGRYKSIEGYSNKDEMLFDVENSILDIEEPYNGIWRIYANSLVNNHVTITVRLTPSIGSVDCPNLAYIQPIETICFSSSVSGSQYEAVEWHGAIILCCHQNPTVNSPDTDYYVGIVPDYVVNQDYSRDYRGNLDPSCMGIETASMAIGIDPDQVQFEKHYFVNKVKAIEYDPNSGNTIGDMDPLSSEQLGLGILSVIGGPALAPLMGAFWATITWASFEWIVGQLSSVDPPGKFDYPGDKEFLWGGYKYPWKIHTGRVLELRGCLNFTSSEDTAFLSHVDLTPWAKGGKVYGQVDYEPLHFEIAIPVTPVVTNQAKFVCMSPVDLEIIDPVGLTINKKINQIIGAVYLEYDINADGHTDDVITILNRKEGDYRITVIPEPDSELTDTYTLEVLTGDTTTVLAENVPISKIPAEAYIFKSCMNPLPSASFSYSPESPVVSQSITFDASSSAGFVTNYEWDFGDGNYGTGKVETHTYSNPGTYSVTLTVEDNEGNTDANAQIVEVKDISPTRDIPISTAANSQLRPTIAYNRANNEYLVTWDDKRSGSEREIYAQRVSGANSLVGSNFAIALSSGTDIGEVNPFVAYNPTANEYLVVWNEKSGHHNIYYIYAQRVSHTGSLLGDKITVSSGGVRIRKLHPTVAYNPANNEYLVVWYGQDVEGQSYRIYGQRLSSSGSLLASNFAIGEDIGKDNYQYYPHVAYNSHSNDYLVVWEDMRNGGEKDIYAQKVSGSGSLSGSNYCICNAANEQEAPSVAYNSADNQYLVTWQDGRTGSNADIYAQMISGAGNVLDNGIAVRVGSGTSLNPSVTYNSKSNVYFIAWEEEGDIFAQAISNDGVLSGSSVVICDATSNQKEPSVAYNSANNQYFITWHDYRNGDFDIYGAINKTSVNISVQVDPSPLINGIDSICALGVPGPMLALNTAPVPVVAGDNDTTPVPSVVVMASGLGNGRVVAFSGGFFTNEAINLYDNKRFGNNVIDWLDKLGKKKVLITRGHREWDGGSNFDNFKAELESRGYTVTRFSGTITPSVLSDVGVVIIGTAWGTVGQSEIDPLTDFVNNGGGLFLTGLGWSWEPYNPGFTLDDYPMNKIAEPYGIRWINGYIRDPTNNYEGHPIFHTFYPNIDVQTTYQAFSYIESMTKAHPNDLSSFLQLNETVRRKYTTAHLLLATETRELNQLSHKRQEIYDFYKRLITAYPQYFGKGVVYDKTTESTMAWIRERTYRSFIDALPLTEVRKSEVASTIGLSGLYQDIWNDFSVLLLDNSCLNEKQKDFIYSYLSLLPKGIHNLRVISVAKYLGHTTPEVSLRGLEGGVNIFGVDIGGYSENSFPDDVPPGIVDGFCIVVAHEVNHVVDAYYIQNNNVLKNRRDKLIADAGRSPLNYLRSMCKDSFFVDAPQEFFASISNQWFTDSKKTIALGLVRFDKGYRHPINQALFFADVYSLGRNFTYFYTIDTAGNIARQMIPLSRDVNGRINSLTIDDQVYTFALDANGNITAYSIQPITSQRILFDESHHQFWTACIDAGLVDFANELRKGGYQVDRLTDSTITTDILSQYEVFVLPGGFIGKYTFDEGPKLLNADEIIALKNFVDNGGGLFLLGCGWSWADYANLSIDINPVNQIGCEFGIKVNDDIVLDPTDHRPNGEGNPIFHEPFIKDYPITQAVHNISACEGLVSSLSIVEPASVKVTVTGDEDSYSGYRPGYYNAGEYPPVVAVAEYGKGRVVFVTQEVFFTSMDDDKNGLINLDEYDNENLAFNIIDWLAHKF
jgi:PKD repeat protein